MFLQRRWAPQQTHRTYPSYVMDLDLLKVDDVIWEPYTAPRLHARAPPGLSTFCTQDTAYFMTLAPLVYDIAVEAHSPDRVQRQFGCVQFFPASRAIDRVPRNAHR